MSANKVLAIAKKYADSGYKEGANNDTPEFGGWYGLNHQPWCAMFVSRVFYDAGFPLKIQTPKGFAYCPTAYAYFLKHQQIVAVRDGQPGDIIFFKFNKDSKDTTDHVGIIYTVNQEKQFFNTFEGNTSPDGSNETNGIGVFKKKRPFLSGKIVAVVRPNWST